MVGGREALPKEGLFELGRHCTLFAIPTYAHWPAQPFNKHCRQGPMQDRPKSPPWLLYILTINSSISSCHGQHILFYHLIPQGWLTSGHTASHNQLSLDQICVLYHTSSQCKSPERSDFHAKVWVTDTQTMRRVARRTGCASHGEEISQWCIVNNFKYVYDWKKRARLLMGEKLQGDRFQCCSTQSCLTTK